VLASSLLVNHEDLAFSTEDAISFIFFGLLSGALTCSSIELLEEETRLDQRFDKMAPGHISSCMIP
jgi:hypothetical protein